MPGVETSIAGLVHCDKTQRLYEDPGMNRATPPAELTVKLVAR